MVEEMLRGRSAFYLALTMLLMLENEEAHGPIMRTNQERLNVLRMLIDQAKPNRKNNDTGNPN